MGCKYTTKSEGEKNVLLTTDKQHPFPFNIPAIRLAKQVAHDPGVTIFVGDNGCRKFTLLETIALQLKLPLIGGQIASTDGFEAARLLKPHLKLSWKRQTEKGFFFRAEDFSDFVNSVEREKQKIRNDLSELKSQVDDTIIEQLSQSQSMNYSLFSMRRDYGENMQAFSHGEAYLKFLSPIKRLSLIAFVLEVLKENNAQFLIATYSPILMGIPDALLYEIREDSMERVASGKPTTTG
jgi:predicted ATPase